MQYTTTTNEFGSVTINTDNGSFLMVGDSFTGVIIPSKLTPEATRDTLRFFADLVPDVMENLGTHTTP